MKHVTIITIAMAALVIAGCGAVTSPAGSGDAPVTAAPSEGGTVDHYDEMEPVGYVFVRVGDEIFSVDMESNSSAKAFEDKISAEPLKIAMHDYGNFEKVGDLPWELETNDEEITTKPGDVILYEGNKITVYYGENTWKFTKLGHLSATPEEITAVFGGKDDITAEFAMDWTE